MTHNGLDLYLKEMQSHIAQYQLELLELHADLKQGQLKSRDYRAAERVLQIYSEVCIGLAKHWVKQLNKVAPTDAYQAFKILTEKGLLSSAQLTTWRKVIGMRNNLVHDYLNLDLTIIEDIIRDKKFEDLQDFCKLAINALTT